MNFLELRNFLMVAFGWNRRVATLATRLANGADTWESIASTPSFLGRPLLSTQEAKDIRFVGTGTITRLGLHRDFLRGCREARETPATVGR